MKKEVDKKKVIVAALGIFVLIVLVIGATYAAFMYSKQGSTINQISTGTITMVYTEGSNRISISDAVPITDAQGKMLDNTGGKTDQVFDFTIQINITGKQAVSFEVTADKVTASNAGSNTEYISTLGNNDVKLYLERQRCNVSGTSCSEYESVMEPAHYTPINASNETGQDQFEAYNREMVLDQDVTQTSVLFKYRLRMWVDENCEIGSTSKRFSVTVNAYGKNGTYLNVDADDVGYSSSESISDALDGLRNLYN